MFSRKRKRSNGDATGADMYFDLRSQALTSVAKGLVKPTPGQPRIGGVVVDVPSSGGFASLVALADGTASMYTSVGGGIIGAGAHAPVVRALEAVLAALDAHIAHFSSKDDDGLPLAGSVRFHVLAFNGPVQADVPEAAFWGREQSPLEAVIMATQHLIGAVQSVGG